MKWWVISEKNERENRNEDVYCVAFPSWKAQLPGVIEACINSVVGQTSL